jgi:hypothetical protein
LKLRTNLQEATKDFARFNSVKSVKNECSIVSHPQNNKNNNDNNNNNAVLIYDANNLVSQIPNNLITMSKTALSVFGGVIMFGGALLGVCFMFGGAYMIFAPVLFLPLIALPIYLFIFVPLGAITIGLGSLLVAVGVGVGKALQLLSKSDVWRPRTLRFDPQSNIFSSDDENGDPTLSFRIQVQ